VRSHTLLERNIESCFCYFFLQFAKKGPKTLQDPTRLCFIVVRGYVEERRELKVVDVFFCGSLPETPFFLSPRVTERSWFSFVVAEDGAGLRARQEASKWEREVSDMERLLCEMATPTVPRE
jgi:hypothetical protein